MEKICCVCYNKKNTLSCSNIKCPEGVCNDCVNEIMIMKKIHGNTWVTCPYCKAGLLYCKNIKNDHDCKTNHDHVKYGFCSICWNPKNLIDL